MRKESTWTDAMKLVTRVPLNGSQSSGQHLPEGLDTVLTGWVSVNLFVPMTSEPVCS